MSHGFTPEELAALPPAERAALEAEPSESEKHLEAGGPGVANAADPLDGTDKVEDLDAGDEAKTPAAAEPAKGEDKADPPADASEIDERDPVVAPFHAPAVDPDKVKAAYEAIEAETKSKRDEINKKYEDGDITMAEMLEEREKIAEERANARAQIDKAVFEAELAAKSFEQVETRLWKEDCNRFLDTHKAYRGDPVLFEALNNRVRALAAAKETSTLSNRQLLERAHADISARLKVDATPPADPVKAMQEKRKPDLSAVPKTLAGVPPAAPQNAETDEFAHLDEMAAKAGGGDADAQAALERAIAKMTPDQQDRWSRAA